MFGRGHCFAGGITFRLIAKPNRKGCSTVVAKMLAMTSRGNKGGSSGFLARAA